MSKRLINAWWIPRKWFVDKTHYICSGQWYPDYQLRLFRNIPGILTLPGRIHESLRVLGRNERLDEICLEHWDLLTPREMREKKTAHYNNLLPGNGRTSFYLYEDETYTCMTSPSSLPENRCVAVIPQKMRKDLRYCAEIAVRTAGETAALLAQDDNGFCHTTGILLIKPSINGITLPSIRLPCRKAAFTRLCRLRFPRAPAFITFRRILYRNKSGGSAAADFYPRNIVK
jgi:hypothetical protein